MPAITLKHLEDAISPLIEKIGELQAEIGELRAEVAKLRAHAPAPAAKGKTKEKTKAKRTQSPANRLALFLQKGNTLAGEVHITAEAIDTLIEGSTEKTAAKLRAHRDSFLGCDTWEDVVINGRDIVGKNLALSFIHRLAVILGQDSELMDQVPAPDAPVAAAADSDSDDSKSSKKKRVAQKSTRMYKGAGLFQQVMSVASGKVKDDLLAAAKETLTDKEGNPFKAGIALCGAIYREAMVDYHGMWEDAKRELPNDKEERRRIIADDRELMDMFEEHAIAIIGEDEDEE